MDARCGNFPGFAHGTCNQDINLMVKGSQPKIWKKSMVEGPNFSNIESNNQDRQSKNIAQHQHAVHRFLVGVVITLSLECNLLSCGM